MSKELISVIVPVYKVEQYLDKCISSVVNQTYKNLEIILVDDGSPDKCPEMCDAWAEKDSRIEVIHKVNGGLSDARNAGMEIVRGEYICFVDSDDWIEPEFCQKLLDALEANQCDIASCKIDTCLEGKEVAVAQGEREVKLLDPEEALGNLIENKFHQVVWNKIYRKSLIEKIPFAVGKYHEDEFWSYQIVGNASKIAAIDYVGYHYIQRQNSIMNTAYSVSRLDVIEAKCQRQHYLTEKYPQLKFAGGVDLLFSCLYHGQKVQLYFEGEQKKVNLRHLKKTVKQNALNGSDIVKTGFKQQIWLVMMQISFEGTCWLRNVLHIGV